MAYTSSSRREYALCTEYTLFLPHAPTHTTHHEQKRAIRKSEGAHEVVHLHDAVLHPQLHWRAAEGHSCIRSAQLPHTLWWPHGAARCDFGWAMHTMHVVTPPRLDSGMALRPVMSAYFYTSAGRRASAASPEGPEALATAAVRAAPASVLAYLACFGSSATPDSDRWCSRGAMATRRQTPWRAPFSARPSAHAGRRLGVHARLGHGPTGRACA